MAVYTPLDYLIGLTILLIIMWLVKEYLFKWVELDEYFTYAAVPVIIFTISIRVLADAGVFEKNELWSVTPGVYVLGTVFGLFVIAVGKLLEKSKGIPYWKGAVITGTLPAVYFTYQLFLQMETPSLILQPYVLALLLTIAIYVVSNFKPSTRIFRYKVNILIIFGHMLDGSATFIGIDKYGFSEEHIIPELLIQQAGTAFVMIPLKVVVILGALYLLEQWKEEDEGSDLYYKMIRFVFFIFGFGPGTRDSLLLGL